MTRPPAPLVIAHRGASGERPENTTAAFDLAVAQRADMIETDLHRARDGGIVLAHDEVLDGIGELGAATLAELRAREAELGTPAIPTLDETLDRFGAAIAWNLELKRGPHGPYAGLEAASLDAVRERDLLGRALFSCFYDSVLSRLRELEPRARIGLLISRRYPIDIVPRALRLGAEAIHPEASIVDAALVEAAHAEGLAVYVFTVDDEAQMRALLALGVDGLFTNFPARMRRLVDRSTGASQSAG